MKTLAVSVLAAAVLLAAAGPLCAQEKPPDWWEAQRELVAILLEQGKEFRNVLKEVTAGKPETGREAMFKLLILMRAGMNKEAIAAIGELKELCPDLANYHVEGIYHEACDYLAAWDVAQSVVETFAANASDITLENRLLKYFLDTGWSVEKVDEWLAARPAGKDNYWVKQRLRFSKAHGRADGLVKELTEAVREKPQDTKGAIEFLDCLNFASIVVDTSWLAKTLKVELATDADYLASRIQTMAGRSEDKSEQLPNWETAVAFYGKAVEMPLTEGETRRLGMMCAAILPGEKLKAMFAVRVREEMAKCLLHLDKAEESQKWMVEAQDLRKKHGLGENAVFAGQVQAASGFGMIEKRIKDQEEKSKDDPEYWLERARYYQGRAEIEQEEEALKKGLALTQPRTEPDEQSRKREDTRRWLLRGYAMFLKRHDRVDEAVDLLRKEIKEMPPGSLPVVHSVILLRSEFAMRIKADDEVLWKWLEQRPRWEYAEQRLLWSMLGNAKRENLNKHFRRAEKLAREKDPSRSHALGEIMNRMGFARRSVALLEYAVKKADKALREEAESVLFASYLDVGDWKRAEKTFPNIFGRLSPRGVSEMYSRIAVVAAKARAKSNAIRIWKAAVNVNPSEMEHLEELAGAGLRDKLVSHYRQMARDMPTSAIPPRALELLGAE